MPLRLISYMSPGFPVSLFEIIASRVDAELHLDTERSGPAPGHDPFADGAYDLGWICATSFVELSLRSAEPSVRLAGVAWVPDDPDSDGRPVYHGDLVTRQGSGIRSVADLAGRRVGCNDEVSLSGHLSLRFEIERLGGDPDTFADLIFTGGHHRSLDLVAAGELDAAVIDSVVRVQRSRTDPAVAALAVVERLGPWPVQPLVAATTLDNETVAAVAASLLVPLDGHPGDDLTAELRAAALRGLVPIEADHYEPVRQAMADHRTTTQAISRAAPSNCEL